MKSKIAALSVTLLLLSACEIIDQWPNIPHPSPGPDPDPAPATELVLENGSLAGFTIYEPEERQNDPRAGEPVYVYLTNGTDAVRLGAGGGYIPDTKPSLFFLDKATIVTTTVGMNVRINDRLSYVVEIDDFEGEVSLARVTLTKAQRPPGSDAFESFFVFAARGEGLGGGVAHNLTIRPVVDGVAFSRSVPISIEAR